MSEIMGFQSSRSICVRSNYRKAHWGSISLIKLASFILTDVEFHLSPGCFKGQQTILMLGKLQITGFAMSCFLCCHQLSLQAVVINELK